MLTRFGIESPMCARRYAEGTCERLKTEELVIQRRSRDGEADRLGSRTPGVRAGGVAGRRAALLIGWRERDLQQRLKSAGGRWDPVRRVWRLRQEVAEHSKPSTARENSRDKSTQWLHETYSTHHSYGGQRR